MNLNRKTFRVNIVLYILYFFLLACYVSYPLIFHINSYIYDASDAYLIVWIQNWTKEVLFTNPTLLFQSPSFYPLENTLAYSHLHLSTTLIVLPFVFLIDEPVALYNLSIILSISLTGFFTCLLMNKLTKNYLASFLGASLFILSPLYLGRIINIHLLSLFFIPLSFHMYMLYMEKKQFKYLLVLGMTILFQMLNSFIAGYILLFSISILMLFAYYKKDIEIISALSIKVVILCITILTIIIIFAFPYFKVSHEFSYVRDIRETIHTAIQPEDFISTNVHNVFDKYFKNLSFNQHPDAKGGFFGLFLTVLMPFLIYYGVKQRNTYIFPFLVVGIVGYILSLGPFLHFGRSTIHDPFPIPLPYVFFYYLVPGFQGFRDSSSFILMSLFGFTLVSAYFFQEIFNKIGKKYSIIIFFIVIALTLIEVQSPQKFTHVTQKNNFPKEHHFLKNSTQDSTYVEMPIYVWNMSNYVKQESYRQYFSTLHFRKSMNGASGFTPPIWEKEVYALYETFPSNVSYEYFKNKGIKYVIVHFDEFEKMSNDNFTVNNKKVDSARSIKEKIRQSLYQEQFITQNTGVYLIQ